MPPVSLTKLKDPEWSIQHRSFYNPTPMKSPAPNAYTHPEVMDWKHKKLTFHKRLKKNKKVIAGPCKVGPTYQVKNFGVGKDSPKWSFTKGPRNKVRLSPS